MLVTDITQTDIKSQTTHLLQHLLASDLNFHGENSAEMSHDFHSFPAKFPPQLPRVFISELTQTGDVILDPMMGSGTTILEAFSLDRQALGFDIDPLAVSISSVKSTCLNYLDVEKIGYEIIQQAEKNLLDKKDQLIEALEGKFTPTTRKFIDYWFSLETQIELISLLTEIEKIKDKKLKNFFQLIFSAIIITKSGGVSLAWDLGHTRPHKLKQGLPKNYRPAIPEFKKRFLKNLSSLTNIPLQNKAWVNFGNAENLSLKNESVDLIFTSPPYASNAIDYMRAHKFSLTWLGYSIDYLSQLRKQYFGGETISQFSFLNLPKNTSYIITKISSLDKKKGLALHRYYSEMKVVLAESLRVLKPGQAAVFVVGSSIMRGINSETHHCLGEIGSSLGFDLAGIGVRSLDRNRRMMPVSLNSQAKSQIEERMHQEYVIGFVKPY